MLIKLMIFECLFVVLIPISVLGPRIIPGHSVTVQQEIKGSAPELKLLSFNFEKQTATRLELEQVERVGSITPTELFTYRAELGGEPKPGNQYFQYQRKLEQARFAVLQVTNESTKAIKSIEWEFTYPHFKGDKEIRYIKSKAQIELKKGDIASLSEKLPNDSDCGVVWMIERGQALMGRNCGRKQKKMTGLYPIEVRLIEISYIDGTVWRAHP